MDIYRYLLYVQSAPPNFNTIRDIDYTSEIYIILGWYFSSIFIVFRKYEKIKDFILLNNLYMIIPFKLNKLIINPKYFIQFTFSMPTQQQFSLLFAKHNKE